jgi:hypothetical protein
VDERRRVGAKQAYISRFAPTLLSRASFSSAAILGVVTLSQTTGSQRAFVRQRAVPARRLPVRDENP